MTVNHKFLGRIQGKRGLLYALLLAVLVSFPHYLGEPIGGALLSSTYSAMAAGLAFAWLTGPWARFMVARADGPFRYALYPGAAVLLCYVAIEAAMLPWFASGGYSAVTSLLCEIAAPLAGVLAVRPEQLVAAWASKGQLVQAAIFLCGMWSLATTFIVQGERGGMRSCRSGLAKPLQLLPFASVVLSVFGARSAFASLGPLVFDVPLHSPAGMALSCVPVTSVLVTIAVMHKALEDGRSCEKSILATALGLMGWSVFHRTFAVAPDMERATAAAAIIASLVLACAVVLQKHLHASADAPLSVSPTCDETSTEPPSLDIEALSKLHLAPRELEVASWAVRGKTSAEIGAALGVQASTVRSTLRRVYAKASVRNLDELKDLVGSCRTDEKPRNASSEDALDPGRIPVPPCDLVVRVDVARSFLLHHPLVFTMGISAFFVLACLVGPNVSSMPTVLLFWVLLMVGGSLCKLPDFVESKIALPRAALSHLGCFLWGFAAGLAPAPLLLLLSGGLCIIFVGGLLGGSRQACDRAEAALFCAALFGVGGICGWYCGVRMPTLYSVYPLVASALGAACMLARRNLEFQDAAIASFAGADPSFFERCLFYLRSQGLSEVQANVLVRIAAGDSSTKIEGDLNYSRGSVNSARRVGYRALGVHTRAQLVLRLQNSCTSHAVHTPTEQVHTR